MKNILAALVLSLVCGLATASPLTASLDDSGVSYALDSTTGFLYLFSDISGSYTTITALCESTEVNKIIVHATVTGVGTATTVTSCTQ